jgi:hypothetical protein
MAGLLGKEGAMDETGSYLIYRGLDPFTASVEDIAVRGNCKSSWIKVRPSLPLKGAYAY